ncbi:MAG: hypothetical protein ABR509_05300, partial [Candidatus Limnocylindria bacterium]
TPPTTTPPTGSVPETGTPVQSVQGGTGTPAGGVQGSTNVPSTNFSSQGTFPMATVLGGLLLIVSLGALAVPTVVRRIQR